MKDKKILEWGRLRISFAWYDIWIGIYPNPKKKTVYICPIPCLLITWCYEELKKFVEKKKEKTPEQLSYEIALLVQQRFKNWVTAEEVFDKFKREFNSLEYTYSLLQSLVFHKCAIVKNEVNSRPKFKIAITKDVRKHVLAETIEYHQQNITTLQNELKDL